jgi:predicted DNA-binding transcriptional regulator AlpA
MDINQARGLLTLDEVCELGQITKRGYRYLRLNGEAPAGVRMGRRLFFTPDEIQAWIAGRARPSSLTA